MPEGWSPEQWASEFQAREEYSLRLWESLKEQMRSAGGIADAELMKEYTHSLRAREVIREEMARFLKIHDEE